MIGPIVTAIVGVVCIVLGISNRKGNINSLHSYHRERVSEEDRLPFGKAVGLGTIIIGVSLIVNAVLTAVAILTDITALTFVGIVIMGIGLAVGIIIAFGAMKKYNKGIF